MMDTKEVSLPNEWIELLKEVVESDITKEEFKEFLKEKKQKKCNDSNE